MGRYDYDADLQRTWRRTASENVEYVLDDGFVLKEKDTARQTKRRYHYAQKPLAVSDSTSTTITTAFLSNDALGSVSDATSTTGEVMTARKYDAWGTPREQTTPAVADLQTRLHRTPVRRGDGPDLLLERDTTTPTWDDSLVAIRSKGQQQMLQVCTDIGMHEPILSATPTLTDMPISKPKF